MYASVAFSDSLTFQSLSKWGRYEPPPHHLKRSLVVMLRNISLLASCLGGGDKTPRGSFHPFCGFLFFELDFGWRETCSETVVTFTWVFCISHLATETPIDKRSFQSSALSFSSVWSFTKSLEAADMFVDSFLVGSYEEYVSLPILTPLCGFHTVLERDWWSSAWRHFIPTLVP